MIPARSAALAALLLCGPAWAQPYTVSDPTLRGPAAAANGPLRDADTPDTRAAMAQPHPFSAIPGVGKGALPPFVLQGMTCHRGMSAIDGDTVLQPRSGGNVAVARIRVRRGNAPEKRGDCPEETALSEVATEYMSREMQPCAYTLGDGKVDPWGRELMWVFNQRGEEIIQKMIDAKPALALPYDGTGPRGGFCPPAAQPARR